MPQRFLRPGITESQVWNSLDWIDQSAFIRLLTVVDDYGRFDARVDILRAHLFALRPDVSRQLMAAIGSRLRSAGMIEFYESDGKEFLQILKWQERVRNKSKWPDPKDSIRQPSAAVGCQNLPPSPSPSPAPTPACVCTPEQPEHTHTDVASPEVNGRNFPTLPQATTHFIKCSDYSRDEIKRCWLGFEAAKSPDTGQWMWGRREVTDWRTSMEQRMMEFRMKNPDMPNAKKAVDFLSKGLDKAMAEMERDTNG